MQSRIISKVTTLSTLKKTVLLVCLSERIMACFVKQLDCSNYSNYASVYNVLCQKQNALNVIIICINLQDNSIENCNFKMSTTELIPGRSDIYQWETLYPNLSCFMMEYCHINYWQEHS